MCIPPDRRQQPPDAQVTASCHWVLPVPNGCTTAVCPRRSLKQTIAPSLTICVKFCGRSFAGEAGPLFVARESSFCCSAADAALSLRDMASSSFLAAATCKAHNPATPQTENIWCTNTRVRLEMAKSAHAHQQLAGGRTQQMTTASSI